MANASGPRRGAPAAPIRQASPAAGQNVPNTVQHRPRAVNVVPRYLPILQAPMYRKPTVSPPQGKETEKPNPKTSAGVTKHTTMQQELSVQTSPDDSQQNYPKQQLSHSVNQPVRRIEVKYPPSPHCEPEMNKLEVNEQEMQFDANSRLQKAQRFSANEMNDVQDLLECNETMRDANVSRRASSAHLRRNESFDLNNNASTSPQRSTTLCKQSPIVSKLKSEIMQIDSMLNDNNQQPKKLLSVINNLRQGCTSNHNESTPSLTTIDSSSARNIAKQLGFHLTSENQTPAERPLEVSAELASTLLLTDPRENQVESDSETDSCVTSLSEITRISSTTHNLNAQTIAIQHQNQFKRSSNASSRKKTRSSGSRHPTPTLVNHSSSEDDNCHCYPSNSDDPSVYTNLLDRIQRLENLVERPSCRYQRTFSSSTDEKHDDQNTTALLNCNNNAQTDSKDHSPTPVDSRPQQQTIDIDPGDLNKTSSGHSNRASSSEQTSSFQISPVDQTLSQQSTISQLKIGLKQPIIMQGHIGTQPISLLNASAAELVATLKNLRTERDSLNESYMNALQLLHNRDNQLIRMDIMLSKYRDQLQTIERLKNVEEILHNQNWDEMQKFVSEMKSRAGFMSKLIGPNLLNMDANIKRLYETICQTSNSSTISSTSGNVPQPTNINDEEKRSKPTKTESKSKDKKQKKKDGVLKN